MKKLFSLFPWANSSLQGVLGQQQQQLWCSCLGSAPRALGWIPVPSPGWDCSCPRITLCVQFAKHCPAIIVPSCQLSSFGRCIFLYFIIYSYYWLEFKDQSWNWQILSKCDPLPRVSEGDLSRILGLSPLLKELFILSPPCATLHSLVLVLFFFFV